MKKRISKCVLMLIIMFSIVYVFRFSNVNVNASSTEILNEITVEEMTDTITKLSWRNNNGELSSNDYELFEKYDVNYDEAILSKEVIIQSELIEFDEVVENTNDGIMTLGIGEEQTDETIHNKGYIEFITKAYALGFYDGGIVYHVEVTLNQLKDFLIKKSDNLIIRHGNNSVTLNLDRYRAQGSLYTPCDLVFETGNKISADEYSRLEPDFSISNGGVVYTFKLSGIDTYGSEIGVGFNTYYGHSTVIGDYYLVATDTTEVQPVFIHNKSLFVESLSIQYGPIGVSISTDGSSDIMNGSSMTLDGYNNRIQTDVLTLQPNEYGFEPQYFFYEKTYSHSLYNWEFTTTRLRTGYIEEQYVNLSPNRDGAGEAYLEYQFDKPIYEIDVNLSFWSASELYKTGDTAYLQYKDSDGEWVTLLDLLNCGLPTDRTNQKYFELEILEGTYEIRFISNVLNPTSTRNKGRICIGEIKFVNWSIE